jgi:hypothetical protein
MVPYQNPWCKFSRHAFGSRDPRKMSNAAGMRQTKAGTTNGKGGYAKVSSTAADAINIQSEPGSGVPMVSGRRRMGQSCPCTLTGAHASLRIEVPA